MTKQSSRRGLNRRTFLTTLLLGLAGVACGRATETGEVSPAGPGPTVPAEPTTAAPVTTTTPTVSTAAVPSSTTTAAPGGKASLTILPRSAWAALPAQADLLVPHSGRIEHLTVHHTGAPAAASGGPQFVDWQLLHMDERGWGDLAYHLLVAFDGSVYAGRDMAFAGDTATAYDPDRHLLVVLEGNFDEHQPSAAQLDRLRLILAWASATYGVTPDHIGGHRDWANTACPGDSLYAYVRDGLAADVQAILDAGGVTLDT